LPKVKINISLAFIVYIIFIVFLGRGFFLLNYMLVLFIHEYSHAMVAEKLGYRLSNITLAPFGICLNIDNSSIEKLDSIKIALAGPCVNFGLAVILMAIWWVFPQTYVMTYAFFEANVVTGIFNLLPCFPLDGGRVLKELFAERLQKKVFVIINLCFSFLFVVLFFVFGFNISILMVAVFLFLSIFSFSKSPKYDYLLYCDKKSKAVMKSKTYVVESSLPLFKLLPIVTPNHFGIFLVLESGEIIGAIYESQLKSIFEKVPSTTTLKSIVLKSKICQKWYYETTFKIYLVSDARAPKTSRDKT